MGLNFDPEGHRITLHYPLKNTKAKISYREKPFQGNLQNQNLNLNIHQEITLSELEIFLENNSNLKFLNFRKAPSLVQKNDPLAPKIHIISFIINQSFERKFRK